MRHGRQALAAVLLASLLAAAGGATSAGAPRPGSVEPAPTATSTATAAAAVRAHTIAVGVNPVFVAVDTATHTAYVGNAGGNTVSVVDTATCNARVSTGCGRRAPTVAVGPGPVDGAVDQATDTIYVVALGGDTVSVIDGATCNATVRTGCGQAPPTITVGAGPDGVDIDQATDTVYVASAGPNDDNTGHTVSVIDGATCNGRVHTGCAQTPATVTVGVGPIVPTVDQETDTIYVPNSNPNGPGTVSVIDGRTCNGTVHTGCGRTPPRIPVGFNTFPGAAAVDEATDTVYEVAEGPALGRLYVIDGARCNAAVTSGCARTPASVAVGSGPIDVAVNPATDTVFAANEEDSTVSVIDGRICDALDTAGCGQRAPVLATGYDPGYLGVDPTTDTVYVANQNENTVSVLDAASCSLTDQAGCRHAAPITTIANGPQGIAVNPLTHTVYAGNRYSNDLSVIDTNACSGTHLAGCGRHWPTVATGVTPQAIAVDTRTDTVYVANADPDNNGLGHTVSVLDGATCNATTTSGCHQKPGTVDVGHGPYALAVDEVTDTIYVANSNSATVSVISGRKCNATVRSGCRATPRSITVGTTPDAVVVDQATDTVYVANRGSNTVSVIDGATCNAVRASGCARKPRTITVGTGPIAEAFDAATDTVYVNDADGGTLSVIDGRTCNAVVDSGCGQRTPTLPTDGMPWRGVSVDQATDTVFLGSITASVVDVYDGATCNSTVRRGCDQRPRTVATGGWPSNLVVDQADGTVYVPDNVDGYLTLFSFVRPGAPTGVVGVAHGGMLRLHWGRPPDGGLPISYRVIPSPACPACRGLTTDVAYTTITGLQPGRAYTFTVTATDAAGAGRRSSPSRPVTP